MRGYQAYAMALPRVFACPSRVVGIGRSTRLAHRRFHRSVVGKRNLHVELGAAESVDVQISKGGGLISRAEAIEWRLPR